MKRIALNSDDWAVLRSVSDAIRRVRSRGKGNVLAVEDLRRDLVQAETLLTMWKTPGHPRYIGEMK